MIVQYAEIELMVFIMAFTPVKGRFSFHDNIQGVQQIIFHIMSSLLFVKILFYVSFKMQELLQTVGGDSSEQAVHLPEPEQL